MDQQQFQQTLREFIRRKPFFPFVVELVNGEQIVVEEATVAFGTRMAGYISPAMEILEFTCDQVRDIRLMTPEEAS
jgi:hypothetical protein